MHLTANWRKQVDTFDIDTFIDTLDDQEMITNDE